MLEPGTETASALRVCIVTSDHVGVVTGLTKSVRRILGLFGGGGPNFTVVSLMLGPVPDCSGEAAIHEPVAFPGAKAYVIGADRGEADVDAIRVRAAALLRALVKRERCNLIHVFYLGSAALIAVRVAQDLGIPVVASARGSDVERAQLSSHGSAQLREILRGSCVVTAVSAHGAQVIERICDVRPRVIYNSAHGAPRAEQGHLPRRPGAPLLAHGIDYHKKGIDELIIAHGYLKEPAPQLRILGERPAHAVRAPVSENVHWLGFLAGGDVARELAGACAYVQASPAEGCPNMLIEAIAMMCPVIASRAGAAAELLVDGESALLFDPYDSGALSSCMQRMTADAGLQRTLAEGAQSLLGTAFSPGQERSAWSKVYADALGRTQAGGR